ncbi:MAG: SusC/RagA family TonB-linked outer membrane protein [Janthinobacterium lividum]
MKKLLHVSVVFLLLFASQVFAQNRTITGTVTAKEDGLPLPGVSVRVQGTTIGTVTGGDGKFSISAPSKNSSLTFTFIGYGVETIPVGTSNNLTVALTSSSRALGEVVVTGALGIKRQAKEQGYAATNITAKTITETHPTNFTNGLTAKAPGLVISTLDNGINPTTRFTLRGNRHINGNNYALVVLNGVPISPNEVNAINPDDIESVNILNGSGAAALYGSEASNGALIITTKRGTSNGAPQITYSNTFQLEKISYFPKLQTQFGSYGGEGPPFQDPVTGFITTPAGFENQSYGPAYNGALTQLGIPLADGTVQKYSYSTPKVDPRYAFFNTGYSEQNSVSYAAGDANNSINFTANRLDKTGVVPNDTYNRSAFRLSGTKTAGILKLDATASYTQDQTSTYNNAQDLLSTLYNTPSWVPIENFKNTNLPFADASTYFNSYGVNPYSIINNARNNTQTDVFTGNFSATVTPTKWIDATYRLAGNFGTYQNQTTREEIDYSAYALSDPTGGYGTAGSSYKAAVNPGTISNYMQYGDGSNFTGTGPQGFSRIQQDIFVNLHHTFYNDFKINLLLGNTIWQEYLNGVSNGSSNLLIKDFYNVNSILGQPSAGQVTEKIRQIAYFGDLTIGYKDYAFLDATLRNDNDSRLSAAVRSFYYPSLKGSFIFTQAINPLKNNKILSFGKLRASYSQVGDVNVSPYSGVNTFAATSGFPYNNIGGLSLSTALNNPGLKPELSKEIEFGFDLGFFDNRINISATYYDNHTRNQTLTVATSPATGYNSTLINVGETDNNGYEFKLDADVLTKKQNKVGLNLGANFTIQNSNVLSLFGNINQLVLGGYTNAQTVAAVGLPYTALFTTDLVRDPQGHPIVNPTTGYPSLDPTLKYQGRTTPKFILGLTQTVSYSFISLNITSEFRTGNVIYDQSLQSATAAGVSAFSAQSGRQRFIFPNSVINTGTAANPVYTPNTSVSVQDGNLGFWDAGAYYSAGSTYVSSGAFWKLREADLNFDLTRFINTTRFIKRASFSLNGRNLVMLRPKTNNFVDPEFSYNPGNGGIGVTNTAQLPPTRFFGANFTVTF